MVARGVDESAQALLALEVRGVLVLGVGCGHDAVDVLSAVNELMWRVLKRMNTVLEEIRGEQFPAEGVSRRGQDHHHDRADRRVA